MEFVKEAKLVELLEGVDTKSSDVDIENKIDTKSSNVDIENKTEGSNEEGTKEASHDENGSKEEEQTALEGAGVVEEISEPVAQCVDEQLVGHLEEIVEEVKEDESTPGPEVKKEKKEGIFTQLGNLFSGSKKNTNGSGDDQKDESEHSIHETEPRLAKLVKEASADSVASSAASSSRAGRRGSNFLPLSRSAETRDGCTI